MGEHFSGASDSGLNLIEYQQNVPLVAQLAKCADIFVPEDIYAALALYRLGKHRADVVGQSRFERRDIVGGNISEALGEGIEILMEYILSGGCQRGDGSAVEG